MFQNILHSFDGSEHAIRAARLAARLVREQVHPSIAIAIVHVVENGPNYLQESSLPNWIARRSAQREEFITIAAGLFDTQVKVKYELLIGDPVSQIIRKAELLGCDLIIMDTCGLNPYKTPVLGKTVQKVICLTKCPVLTTQ